MIGLPNQPSPKGNPMKPKTMTGAEFKLRFKPLLDGLKDNDEIMFGGGELSFYRPKDRGPTDGPRLVDIEFNEIFKVTVQP
jgi:hypothetical protein